MRRVVLYRCTSTAAELYLIHTSLTNAETEMISQIVDEYTEQLPEEVEQCISVPAQSTVNQQLLSLFSGRALEHCSTAVSSFRGDCEQTPKSVPSSSASAPTTLSRTLHLKDEGDREWNRNNYAAAIARWREALSGFVILPNLLNNLAQVCTRMKTDQSSLQFVLAVLAVQLSNAKACVQAATIALHVGWLQASADCAARGLRLSPAHPDLLSIQRQARDALRRSDTTAGASSTPPAVPQSAQGRGIHARLSLIHI